VSAADAGTADLDAVRGAYGRWASVYIDLFGSADKASAEERAVIEDWSGDLTGPVLDAGCGPGHWSAFLHARGVQVEGVDATPAFVAHATRTYPEIPFRLGDLRDLRLPAGSLGGVLAWFSLIHLDPEEVPGVVRTFAAALRPGGTVLLGFFAGQELRPFGHRVVTAWTWPLDRMVGAVERAGLEVVRSAEHPQPSGRVFAEIVARRPR
jgi:SAM-dependent methyltransferase